MNDKSIQGLVFYGKGGAKYGIPGVKVSNGKEVVLTNKEGRYELPRHGQEGVVFICKPSGYRLPTNAHNQPQFFCFLRPSGSPQAEQLQYPAFPAIPERESIDFELLPAENKRHFRAVFFGDIQPKTSQDIQFFRQLIVNHLLNEEMDFFVPLGDIAWDGLSLYPEIREALASVQRPYFPVCGNHDINFRARQPAWSRETFQRYFAPSYYSFDQGDAHFVVLDDIGYRGWDEATDSKGYIEGRLSEQQLQWLSNDLALVPKDRLLVLLMHIPIYTDILPEDDYRNIQNRDKLFELLQGRENLLALAAHTHFIEQVKMERAGWAENARFQHIICGAACGAWWKGPRDWQGLPVRLGMDGAPNGYWIFDFDGSNYNYRFQAAGSPAREQIGWRYPIEGPLAACTDGCHIIANVYAASPEATVTVQIGDATPRTMERSVMPDPLVLHFLEKFADEYPNWMKPRDCAHLWKAPMPANLPPGTHYLSIRALEPDGRTIESKRCFQYTNGAEQLQILEDDFVSNS